MFATYPNEDYDRRNEDVDPMAASAEYELEKRVERLDLFPVELEKGRNLPENSVFLRSQPFLYPFRRYRIKILNALAICRHMRGSCARNKKKSSGVGEKKGESLISLLFSPLSHM